ncbi:unnamed protein product, partial [Heterosigma akashiwo]
MRENAALLRKIERTAAAVLDIFADLELAVEEKEPELAQQFFESLRKWVGELHTQIQELQVQQRSSTNQVHDLMGKTVDIGEQEFQTYLLRQQESP